MVLDVGYVGLQPTEWDGEMGRVASRRFKEVDVPSTEYRLSG